MKKLKIFICFAAVLVFGTQFVTAQNFGILYPDDFDFHGPSSAMGEATNGRFATDVDLFFGVNDWADVEFSKWFSYLKMQDIQFDPLDLDDMNAWEGGIALKLDKSYLALYYNGRFNNGTQDMGETYINYNDDGSFEWIGPDLDDVILGWPLFPDLEGITRRNYFGVLLGIGDHGFRFTVEENINVIDLPYVTDVFGVWGPAGSYGKFWTRYGTITPKLEWGAAKDMNLGKFSTRPSASLALKVEFWQDSINLTDDSGNTVYFSDFSDNSLTPILGVDTGAMLIKDADWGKLFIGAGDEFQITVYTDQRGGGYGDGLSWKNKLNPYAVFSYTANEFFSLGAKLNVPIYFGWDYFWDDSFIGIGVSDPWSSDGYDYATLGTGFQLKGSIFNKWSEKYLLPLDKLTLNWGVKVNLPAYAYYGYYETHKIGGATYVVKDKTQHWKAGDNENFLQIFTAGITFELTPNIVFDFSIHNGSGSILLSVKHNGSSANKAAAPVPAAQPVTEEAE